MVDHRPTGLRRALLRAPIRLYRARLGWLLRRRFVYVVHRGRTSGLRREVVLEAVTFDAAAPEVVVVAAWGAGSDWYRNISATPALEVRVGGERWVLPRQRVLDAAEMTAALRDYGRRHPRAWRALAPRLGFDTDLSPATAEQVAQRFPAVAFSRAG